MSISKLTARFSTRRSFDDYGKGNGKNGLKNERNVKFVRINLVDPIVTKKRC